MGDSPSPWGQDHVSDSWKAEEPLCPWERTVNFWVDEGPRKGLGLAGGATVCRDKWSGWGQDWEPRQTPLNCHQSRKPVCPDIHIYTPRGQKESPTGPHDDTVLGRRKERTHSERLLIPKDGFILKTVFWSLQMTPNWTRNRLLKCRGDFSPRRAWNIAYCQVWTFPDTLRAETYEELGAVLKEKRSYCFFAHLSFGERILWLIVFFDLKLEPLVEGYSNR